MARQSTAQHAAIGFLRTKIEQLLLVGQKKLPAQKELANQAGVSHVTMLRAVETLCAEGELRTVVGLGTFIISEAKCSGQAKQKHKATAVETKTGSGMSAKIRSIKSRLEQEILSDLYPAGTLLPSVKQLCYKTGACFRTVRPVLEELVKDGYIEPHKRSYRVVPLPLAGGVRHTVVLVVRGAQKGQLLVMPRTWLHVHALESHCAQLSLRLRIVTCNESGEFDASLLKGSDSILGILVWTIGIDVESVTVLLTTLSRLGLPLSILDEAGSLDHLPRLFPRAHMRFFSMANREQDGEIAGRYLITKGYRSVAFFSLHHATAWSINRWAGIDKTFSRRGHANAVKTFVYQEMPVTTRLALRKGSAVSEPANTSRNLVLFEKAIKEGEFDVWVGASDLYILPAIQYLRARRLHKTPALFGFDDSPDAVQNRLSSYNFNGSAVMREMLAHVLNPHAQRSGRSQGHYQTIDGFVTERESG